MANEMARGCSEVDISCYSNDNIAVMLETGIKSRHHLEARFRKLYRAIAQLGEEKKGRKDMPRQTASRRRSSSTSKNHFVGACWTSGGESCLETRSTSIPETLSRGQSAFREALDEAREILGVRKSHFGVVAASIREAFPACKTRLSVQDESANISVSYDETNQTTSSPPKLAGSMGGSSSTYESGRKEKGTEHFLCSKSRWPRNRPQETSRKQPGAQTQHHRSLCSTRSTNPTSRARGSFDEGTKRRKATPRRVKTVYVGAKRGGSNGKSLKVRLQLNNENSPETSSSEYNASNKGISKDKNSGTRKTAPCRSAPLHQGLRTMNSLKDNDHSKQRKRAGRYESSEESRESSDRDNERRCSRWQEKQRGATQRKSRVVDGGHREIEPDGKERHVAYEGGSNIRGSWKQQYFDNSSGEEIEEDAGDQQRWRNRGRVLWSTHAEPAARATSTGSTRAASHKVRSHSQPATRPYYGLYARSLRANGIDPTNFRASRWGYDAAGLSCAEAQEHVDGSLLWRGNRGDDPFAAKRARAPTDGLPDRLEAGRVLDSFNRRAELLGIMPPTPLRTKAAWMETPGDPEYSLRESSEGLLSSFCDASSRVSTSLRAARADRRFVKYSLCAGKLHVDPSPAAATSLLEAASAWSTPYGQRSANTCVGARRGGEETQRARSRKSIAQGTVGRNCGYHAREGWGPTRCPCGESAGDRNRESHYKLCRRRHSTTSVGGAARFVGSLAI